MEKTYRDIMEKVGLSNSKKREILRNCSEKARGTHTPSKGRGFIKMAVAACLTVVLTCTVIAAVNQNERRTVKDIYEGYEQVVEEANERYGLELILSTSANVRLQIPVGEFRTMVEQYCLEVQKLAPVIPPQWEGAKKVSCTVVCPYAIDVVFITFYGTFAISQNADWTYSVTSEDFSVMTRGPKGILTYEMVGDPEVKQTKPGFYSVEQSFRILNYGIYDSTTILRVEFRVDPATGDIYMSEQRT